MKEFNQLELNNLFREMQDDCFELFQEKNKRYDSSFFKQCEEDGDISSVPVRLSDKVNRIKTLVKGTADATTDESIEDTLKDLANYSIMALTYLSLKYLEKKKED